MAEDVQGSLFGDLPQEEPIAKPIATPAKVWEADAAKRALDELFTLTFQYKGSKAYYELLQFVARFRFYSPFNAMLIHMQMSGAKYVAPPHRWLRDYGRSIKTAARPIVILQPMGPVMFVFDVSDTEPTKDARPLPPEVERPFEVRGGHIGRGLEMIIENAKRDGLRTTKAREGSQSAGSIRSAAKDVQMYQKFRTGYDEHLKPIFLDILIRYEMIINERLSHEAQYVTIVHELAHLYCGHLGTPNNKWWPDRRGLNKDVLEFEAESVAYLVCSRANIDNPSEKYLSGYVGAQIEVPAISLECLMKAAGLIETMSKENMKPRKAM
jgi:hypothetical protein